MNFVKFYILLLLSVSLIACNKDDMDKETFNVNYFFDENDPESCYYIFSMAKSNDGSIIFSAYTARNQGQKQSTDLYRFNGGIIEKIVPEIYFTNGPTYQYENIKIYEENNLLIIDRKSVV